jgi:phosphocarrier protein HPr
MMQQRTVTITNRLGLHARAAAKLVRLAGGFRSQVWLTRADTQHKMVNAKSIFNVLLLAAAQGTALELFTEGEDETAAAEALCKLIADKFGEE